MITQDNVRIVKEFFAAMGSGDKQRLLALSAEDIEWIIPGEWACGRHAPRTRGIDKFSSEGPRNGGDFNLRTP
jgi:ketosteroid isomerase-like protein